MGGPDFFIYLIVLYEQNLKECITINVYHTIMLTVTVIVQTLKWSDSRTSQIMQPFWSADPTQAVYRLKQPAAAVDP